MGGRGPELRQPPAGVKSINTELISGATRATWSRLILRTCTPTTPA